MTPLQNLTLLNKFLFVETPDIPKAHEATVPIRHTGIRTDCLFKLSFMA